MMSFVRVFALCGILFGSYFLLQKKGKYPIAHRLVPVPVIALPPHDVPAGVCPYCLCLTHKAFKLSPSDLADSAGEEESHDGEPDGHEPG